MERETVEGLRLGTSLIFISAVLTVGLLVFWYARTYSNLFFEDAAQQNIAMKTVELSGLEVAGKLICRWLPVFHFIQRVEGSIRNNSIRQRWRAYRNCVCTR